MEHPVKASGQNALKYDRQLILDFIICYKRDHDGNSPAHRDIMRAFGISSTSVVNNALRRMSEMGTIRLPVRGQSASRSIEVVGGQWSKAGDKTSNELRDRALALLKDCDVEDRKSFDKDLEALRSAVR
jgi:hypothetical protein